MEIRLQHNNPPLSYSMMMGKEYIGSPLGLSSPLVDWRTPSALHVSLSKSQRIIILCKIVLLCEFIRNNGRIGWCDPVDDSSMDWILG